MIKILTILFLATTMFSQDSLDNRNVNTIFRPFLSSIAKGDFSQFTEWFSKNATVTQDAKKQLEIYLSSQLAPRLPLLGKVQSTKIIYNKITNDRYGAILFLQIYDNQFMIWRFNYFVKNDNSLSINSFNIDNENDIKDLVEGKYNLNGPPSEKNFNNTDF